MSSIPDTPPGGKKALYADPDRKPAMLPVLFDGIPDVLKALARWLLWSLVWTGKKWDKPPLQPNGAHARSNAPSTWTTFGRAKAAYEAGGFTGIGFVPGAELGLTLIDLFHGTPKPAPASPPVAARGTPAGSVPAPPPAPPPSRDCPTASPPGGHRPI